MWCASSPCTVAPITCLLLCEDLCWLERLRQARGLCAVLHGEATAVRNVGGVTCLFGGKLKELWVARLFVKPHSVMLSLRIEEVKTPLSGG